MSKFEEVDTQFAKLPYMGKAQASLIRQIITEENAETILEIGFFHGKSSAYIAAILEDRGKGSLTTIDLKSARNRKPNIFSVLDNCGLSHRVNPIFAHRSFTWELQKMTAADPRPIFDLCYFDGGHTWDNTGFGVLLVDMLLKPGGILILDDMDWSIAGSPSYKEHPERAKQFSPDEQEARSVRLVWDLILPHLGYSAVDKGASVKWGIARKGLSGAAALEDMSTGAGAAKHWEPAKGPLSLLRRTARRLKRLTHPR